MTELVDRNMAQAFYEAYAKRDAGRVAEFLDENVEWTISGPVDLLRFCGVRHGKAAVVDMIERLVPQVIDIFSFVTNTMLVDGDRVATLNRLWGRRRDDGRVISYRLAHFLRFRGGKVVENISLIDSFDAVEQVLGHPLAAHGRDPAALGDVVAV